MLIKICGLRDKEIAKKGGISWGYYIGLLFSKVSSRNIELDLAKEITRAVKRCK